MKVIDLLNKIANGEELKFKLKNDDLTYSIKKDNYLRIEELNRDVEWYIDKSWLNEEVEIIEEDKKIEKWEHKYDKQAIDNFKDANFNSNDMKTICNRIGWLMDNTNSIADKINEIIEVINNVNDGS